jgi:ABC-type sugar transport system permease subunit
VKKYFPIGVLLAALVATPRGLSYEAGEGFVAAVLSVFSHVDLGHMLPNIAVLLVLSRPWRASAFRLFFIFLTGGLCGNVAVTIFSQRPVLGASAGVLAVLVFETVLGARQRDIHPGLLLASIVSMLVYTAGFRVSHLREGSSYVPHVVGVSVGMLCVLLFIAMLSLRTVTRGEITGR